MYIFPDKRIKKQKLCIRSRTCDEVKQNLQLKARDVIDHLEYVLYCRETKN